MTVRRTWMISGSSVVISMSGSTGVQQARSILDEPATRTMHMPQAAVASRSGCLHSVGNSTETLRAASRMVVPASTSTGRLFIRG